MQALLIISAIIAITSGHGYGEDNLGLQGRAQYQFEYGVNDPQTGDIKSQREQRDGQQLTGQYTLREADGTRRVVRYRAGPQSGFEAVVQRIGQAQHPAQSGQGGLGHEHHRGYGNVNSLGGAGGRSFVGATEWRNQGFGGDAQFDQSNQGQGYQHGNVNSLGGAGGRSFIGGTEWRNQGFGGAAQFDQGNQGQGYQHRYGNGNSFGGSGGRSYVGPIQWRNQGSGRNGGYEGHGY